MRLYYHDLFSLSTELADTQAVTGSGIFEDSELFATRAQLEFDTCRSLWRQLFWAFLTGFKPVRDKTAAFCN